MSESSQEPKAVCAKHGEHTRQFVEVSLSPRGQYPFCPYCYGEWMAQQFPVTVTEVGV